MDRVRGLESQNLLYRPSPRSGETKNYIDCIFSYLQYIAL